MRFIHIADVHLGAGPDAGAEWAKTRLRELWDALERVVDICRKEETDLLLIAGDLFHRQPLLRELKEVDYLFSTLPHTRVVLIAGNHDYIGKSSYYRTFPWSGNVYTLFGKKLDRIEFPDLQTAVYGLSYYSRELREPLYDDAVAEGRQKYEILLAHGGDEKHIPIDWKKLERAGFCYIALGHIHRPQAVRRDRIVYAGALEPSDRGDMGPHGYVKGEASGGSVRTWWIPSAQREYIRLEIPVVEGDTEGSVKTRIRQEIESRGEGNIYKIALQGVRGRGIIFHPETLKSAGRIVEIEDETHPAWDFDRLCRENKGTLIEKYIGRFADCEPGSREYEALCEGVEALMENRRTV